MTRPTPKCRSRVRKHINDHFPEMGGLRPKVSTTNHGGEKRHRFTYRKRLSASNGAQFQQVVHLTVDEEGKVLKVAVSR